MFDARKVTNQCIIWIRKFFEENGKDCNDSRLAKLPPEARQYLHGIFMDMIDKYPRH